MRERVHQFINLAAWLDRSQFLFWMRMIVILLHVHPVWLGRPGSTGVVDIPHSLCHHICHAVLTSDLLSTFIISCKGWWRFWWASPSFRPLKHRLHWGSPDCCRSIASRAGMYVYSPRPSIWAAIPHQSRLTFSQRRIGI